MSTHNMHFHDKLKQEALGPRFAHLSKTAIAYLQMPCHTVPVLPQQLGQKFDDAVKRYSSDHHLNKLGKPWVSYAIYQDSASSFLGSEEEFYGFFFFFFFFVVFFTIYGHGGHLVPWCETFRTKCQYPSTKVPCEIWWKLFKRFRRIRRLRITQFYTCT